MDETSKPPEPLISVGIMGPPPFTRQVGTFGGGGGGANFYLFGGGNPIFNPKRAWAATAGTPHEGRGPGEGPSESMWRRIRYSRLFV